LLYLSQQTGPLMQTLIRTAILSAAIRSAAILSAAILSAAIFSGNVSAASSCRSESTALKPRPLTELYTSEGCSSCPPADRWLSGKRASIERGDFSAIAWHVDYWDQLGWKDPFSIPAAAPRQRMLASQSGSNVYTPGVFLNGREWRRWSSGTMPETPQHTAPALVLNVKRLDDKLHARIEVSALTEKSTLVLVTQLLNRDSQVKRGENSGKVLHHDFSASEVQQTSLAANSATQTTTADLTLPTGSSAITAFIENARGQVLQSTQIFLDGCALE